MRIPWPWGSTKKSWNGYGKLKTTLTLELIVQYLDIAHVSTSNTSKSFSVKNQDLNK